VSASGGQKNNFGQLLTFAGLLYRPSYTDQGQMSCARAGPISSECVHCVAFRWPKTTILAKFVECGGFCTDPLSPMRAKFGVLEQTQGLHLQAKFHLNVFIVLASGGQKTTILGKF